MSSAAHGVQINAKVPNMGMMQRMDRSLELTRDLMDGVAVLTVANISL